MMEASDWLCSAKHKLNQSEVMMDQVRINWVLKVVSWIRPFLSFLMTFKSEECLGTVIKWKINNHYKMNNCLAQSVFMFNPFFTLILIIRNLVLNQISPKIEKSLPKIAKWWWFDEFFFENISPLRYKMCVVFVLNIVRIYGLY